MHGSIELDVLDWRLLLLSGSFDGTLALIVGTGTHVDGSHKSCGPAASGEALEFDGGS